MRDSRKTLNRRDFISRSLAGAGAGAAVILGGVGKPGAAQAQTAAGKSPASMPIITRTLGKTGIKLPVVNMGVMNADNPELVRKAFEVGIRHFDTAAGYQRGRNEEMVGTVLESLKAREQAIIATKVNIRPAQVASLSTAELKDAFIRVAEGSLKRLRTDYIDILYIHDVSKVEDLGRQGFLDALTELKTQKKVRFVGFSTHQNMGPTLDEAARTGFYDVVLASFSYALAGYPGLRRSFENAAAKGIGIVAMKTQCMQSWYREGLPTELQSFYGGTIVQTAVLKWVLQHEFITCAVPGFTNFRELDEDFSVARDLKYNEMEKKFLADRNVQLAMAHCIQCGGCLETCPLGVDTRTLMRAHMYLRYPNVFQARDTLESLPADRGLVRCGSCDACQAHCRGRIDIGKRIEQLKIHFA